MNTRTFSQAAIAAMATLCCPVLTVNAQSSAGYYTDPDTGIVYQKVTKTIDRPVVETKVEQREQTVYRPQTVTETRPENRTIYSPVVEYRWEPRLHGRWNPFRQPTVQYHHVGRTRWEARNEVVQRSNTRTDWVAEKRTVDVPQRIVRMQREQKVDYEPVGRVAPKQASPPGATNGIAQRLRPLNSNETVAPLRQSGPVIASRPLGPPRVAASTVGRMTSDPPRRSLNQGGLPATTLAPVAPGVHGQPLPPATSGIAAPALPIFR